MQLIIISMKNQAQDRKSTTGLGPALAYCPRDATVPKGTGEHPSHRGAWGWHGDIHHGKCVMWALTKHTAMARTTGCSYLGKFLLQLVKACFPCGVCGWFAGNSCASVTAQPGEAQPEEPQLEPPAMRSMYALATLTP